MDSPQIPQVAWTVFACILVAWGILNVASALSGGFEGVDNPPSLTKGILCLVGGLGYFVTRIIYKYRKKNS